MKEPIIVTPKEGELLPCPFCGSEAGLEHDAEGTMAKWYVYCRDVHDDCPISLTNTSGQARRVEAVDAWNRRTK
jgi:Lar family restriction alleviation protein